MSNAYKERNLEPVPHWRGKCILLIPFAKSLLFTNEIVIKLLWILVCDLRHTYCLFKRWKKHIEHFLYLTIYSISIDYETSVCFRNSRSEKAQGASLFTPNLRTEHKGSSPSFCYLTIYDHPYTTKYTKYFIVKGWSHSKKTYSPWSCGQKTREALFVGWQYISFRWDDAGNIQVH